MKVVCHKQASCMSNSRVPLEFTLSPYFFSPPPPFQVVLTCNITSTRKSNVWGNSLSCDQLGGSYLPCYLSFKIIFHSIPRKKKIKCCMYFCRNLVTPKCKKHLRRWDIYGTQCSLSVYTDFKFF